MNISELVRYNYSYDSDFKHEDNLAFESNVENYSYYEYFRIITLKESQLHRLYPFKEISDEEAECRKAIVLSTANNFKSTRELHEDIPFEMNRIYETRELVTYILFGE